MIFVYAKTRIGEHRGLTYIAPKLIVLCFAILILKKVRIKRIKYDYNTIIQHYNRKPNVT